MSNSDYIQPEEMQAVLQSSGYLLEGRVGQVLEEAGFTVQFNAFQPHPRQEEDAIEIDVRGFRSVFMHASDNSSVAVVPLIECKNNSQPIVFFVRPQSIEGRPCPPYRYAGFPTFSRDMDAEKKPAILLHELLQLSRWHHYAGATEVATQFCGFSRLEEKQGTPRKDWRWRAESMQNYSQSFSNLCVAANYGGFHGFGSEVPNIQVEFYYPVVVFQGPLHTAATEGATVNLKAADHVAFVHSTSVSGRVLTAEFDMITEGYLSKLLEVIDGELTQMAQHILKMYDKLLVSAKDQRRAAGQPCAFPKGPVSYGRGGRLGK